MRLNDRVPAPTLRATEGDRVRIIFHNQDGHSHSLHFHGTHPVEMDGMISIRRDQTTVYEFDAEPYGVHPYHCHVAPITRHVDKGLYGLFIVDPPEGGEAGTTGNSDVDYMTTLGLMKGHLIAAQELMELQNYEQAAPHIGHLEELYSSIEPMLPEKGVQDFKPTLNQLHDLAQSAPDSPEMQTLFDESIASIDEAIAAIPESQRNSPEFTMDVIVEMLKTAATEYEAAIANNQFVEVVEYQDSRGFVLYADELYQTIAEQKSQTDPEGHQTITDSMAELKTVWPSIEPPPAPVKTLQKFMV